MKSAWSVKTAAGKENEVRFWNSLDRANILTVDGDVIQGRVEWVEDYTIGFVPEKLLNNTSRDIHFYGMERGKTTMVFKSMIRCITPARGEDGQEAAGGKDPFQRFQPMATANSSDRKKTR